MGTLGILKALLLNIQGEANPLYAVERRWRTGLASRAGCVAILGFPVLFASLALPAAFLCFFPPLITSANSQVTSGTWIADSSGSLFMMVTCFLISLAWTFLPATVGGQIIRRERAAQTWDSILVTPYTTDAILLAKAAASTRDIWGSILSIASMTMMLRVGLIVAMLALLQVHILTQALVASLCLIIVVIEPLQEIVLALVVSLNAAILGNISRLTLVFGAVGGVLIRFTQIIIVLLLMPLLQSSLPTYLTSVNAAIIGTPALLLSAPTILSAVLVIIVIAAREALIRILFAWTVRRAHES